MRDISTAISDILNGSSLTPFFAITMALDSGTINMWTGIGDLVTDTATYSGVGTMLDIGQIDETAEMSASGATVTLSGIPSSMLSLALDEQYQGRVATIMFGVTSFTASSWAISNGFWNDAKVWLDSEIWYDSNYQIMDVFSGYLDQMNISESSDTCTISVSIESKLIDLERPRIFRYNSASQKSLYPSDLGFDFVESLQNKQFTWGRK